MHARAALLSIACLAVPVAWAQPGGLVPKQLSGPPEEFAAVRAPDPADAAILSKSALLPVEFGESDLWRGRLPVEGAQARLLVFGGAGRWQLELQQDARAGVPARQAPSGRAGRSWLGIEAAGRPARRYEFEGLEGGEWTLQLRAAPGDAERRGYVLVEGDARTRLASWQSHRRQLVGERIGLTALLTSEDGDRARSGHDAGAIVEASLRVIDPDGAARTWPMADDGRGADGAAGDGLYAGAFVPDRPGTWIAQVTIRGRDDRGNPVLRSAEHVLPVLERGLRIADDRAVATAAEPGRLSIAVPVALDRGAPSRYRVTGEVWGSDDAGNPVPVAWVGGMVAPEGGRLPIGLDARWVQRAGALPPFELRALRIEDPDHFVPLAAAARMPLALPSLPPAKSAAAVAIDDTMRMGPRPATLRVADDKANGGRLLLVHGYCSAGVWPEQQFASASSFIDAHQNRSHDQFAQLLGAFGAGWDSFGTVAHSQGGAAALHLYAYYWSGLDNASGARLMQSVGTPYQGTNLSGIIATIGSWFGVACGSNSNMTYSGASAWLAGVPGWARAQVNYHTTSFSTAWYRWDYCHMASDLVLDDPEDGTVERASGQLPGAINRGHATGQCHTTGMRDPAQYLDAGRNATMNANAAR
ncbi:conditioned medium factor [Luteimonas sp. SJ-92]|uniref:Conditioned medium factor n=2 Tax=Luteimonas salinisoli TaxID=2752307 RepID=A0A853J8R2_9GAMM|nr:choice-of-anchor X domain-containing protein [Luteimonas salinisoli]NZA25088.1 conditioned medium factor [Luteimonas salinisoli]